MSVQRPVPHSSHWGPFTAGLDDGKVVVTPHPDDPNPSLALGNIPAAARHPARIGRPLVRRGWLENGPGPDPRRGRDEYVALPWQEVEERLAAELVRVRDRHGPGAIFGGSYGWSSAGRFHHAQSQLHRFLNLATGGYVASVNTYSAAAAEVILPHVIGTNTTLSRNQPFWPGIAADTDLVVAFGGLPVRNTAVSSGGSSMHIAAQALAAAADRGAGIVYFSPIRDDLPQAARGDWQPIVPGTDVAVMLALAHTLISEERHDRAFLASHCVGYARWAAYVLGSSDGIAKTPEWAAAISSVPADMIRTLARRMAAGRTLVTVNFALQRAEHGEQPVWAGLALAALLGQIGLPGGGFCCGLASAGNIGKRPLAVPLPVFPQGRNPHPDFIPVARIADMLLHPGEPYRYNGQERTYPDIRLVYWVGGNPFHHHQDLRRLSRAFGRPETVVVHEQVWTATASHADIVLPATVTLERDDMAAANNEPRLHAMHRLVEPFAEARDDYAIFSALSGRVGCREAFTEGLDAQAWLERIFEPTRQALAERGDEALDFATFWQRGELVLPEIHEPGPIARFRADPAASPLPTPSGRIELFSETIASFGLSDCPGHPVWLAPSAWLGAADSSKAPLQLVANQPASRLHSQLDFGAASQATKVAGREPLRIHPDDAAPRGIRSGDPVLVRNDQGAFLAGAVLSEDIRPGVVQVATGAWYAPHPLEPHGTVCIHGNPNMVTRDVGTSSLAQGCTGQLAMVEVERYAGELPPVRVHAAPG
ncbi:molybdopterin-dependent oxidoreductase [Geminicoccus roseus]|uniref:molybdopterin-dependent oxidoreductase n=1 Tax=Geminicoccus roseus TaxID=404900 RepID=UPI00048203B9|nr:molybdopterin-dependent oxidoreductase [Geminicoccus roseus]